MLINSFLFPSSRDLETSLETHAQLTHTAITGTHALLVMWQWTGGVAYDWTVVSSK